ncbi:MAG TPA: DEAD/DEAH box helicase [Thermomicrobiales bacterium]
MKSPWAIYGVGGQLASIASLFEDASASPDTTSTLFEQLQRTLSAVAVRSLGSRRTPRPDTRFIAELALGLLRRGQPTLSSPWVENTLVQEAESSAELKRVTRTDPHLDYHIRPTNANARWTDWILAALLPVDQRLQPAPDLPFEGGEFQLFNEFLMPALGDAWGWIEPQRPLSTMVAETTLPQQISGWKRIAKRIGDQAVLSLYQRVDFAVETAHYRLNIELDGPQHDEAPQRLLDERRDNLLKNYGWQVRRIRTKDLPEKLTPEALPTESEFLRHVIESDPLLARANSFNHSDRHGPLAATSARLGLVPHAIARVQLGIILGLLHGHLDLRDTTWRIAVIERDVPCARLAVLDLVELIHHLCGLYDVQFDPHIELSVLPHHEFMDVERLDESFPPALKTRIHLGAVPPERLTSRDACLILDIAVRARWTQSYGDDPFASLVDCATGGYIIRTAHRLAGEMRPTWSAPRPIPEPRQKLEHLEYFLRLLFRKPSFREGQIDIIERALRRESVIGLLPTGAGKSLTFQLPTLLSPGFTIVVCPIKSLMQDQVDNLSLAGINRATMINSDLTPGERERATREITRGLHRLVYISPERLQIDAFRQALRIACSHYPIPFVAVDEAHCVSEWGHDFRTAYLNLGRHAREYCRYQEQEPPLLALTATASRAVLIDVQRELDITDPAAIISPSSFERPELRFQLIKVPTLDKHSTLKRQLHKLRSELQDSTSEFASGKHGGIIFCPHIDNRFGILEIRNFVDTALSDIFPRLAKPLPDLPESESTRRVHMFAGRKPRDLQMTEEQWNEYKRVVQRLFKSDRIPVIVATSAFGMGIDKPNIRYTIHFAMTQTVEEFAQQAGRAGRDRNPAICAIIFSDARIPLQLDPLAEGISNEEARKRSVAQDKSGQRDDSTIALYLFQRGYLGEAIERDHICEFYQRWILSAWTKRNIGVGEPTQIIVSKNDVRLALQRITHPTQEDKRESRDTTPLDKILYRLSLIGIVEDYTIDYNARTYAISTRRIAEEDIYKHLFRYVRRYRREDVVEEIRERLEKSDRDDPAERAIAVLCWFVYDVIETTRRMAIRNMREILRKCHDGEQLRHEINNFLSFNIFTREVTELLQSSNQADWWKIADKVTSSNDAQQLLGQVRRVREADPSHPGLLILQGLALTATPDSDLREASDLLLLGMVNYARSPLTRIDDIQHASRQLMSHLVQLSPRGWPEVTRRFIHRYQQARDQDEFAVLECLVRSAYLWIRQSNVDPAMKRAAALPYLKVIAAQAQRLVASHLESNS